MTSPKNWWLKWTARPSRIVTTFLPLVNLPVRYSNTKPLSSSILHLHPCMDSLNGSQLCVWIVLQSLLLTANFRKYNRCNRRKIFFLFSTFHFTVWLSFCILLKVEKSPFHHSIDTFMGFDIQSLCVCVGVCVEMCGVCVCVSTLKATSFNSFLS